MRIFVVSDDVTVASFNADAAPRVGDHVWVKTLDGEFNVIVQAVEHQFDRSSAANYTSHDVTLFCRHKRQLKT